MERNYWFAREKEAFKMLEGGARIASVAITILVVGSALTYAFS